MTIETQTIPPTKLIAVDYPGLVSTQRNTLGFQVLHTLGGGNVWTKVLANTLDLRFTDSPYAHPLLVLVLI